MGKRDLALRQTGNMPLIATVFAAASFLIKFIFSIIPKGSYGFFWSFRNSAGEYYYGGMTWKGMLFLLFFTLSAGLLFFCLRSVGKKQVRFFAVPVLLFLAGYMIHSNYLFRMIIGTADGQFLTATKVFTPIMVLLIAVLFLLNLFGLVRCKKIISLLLLLFLGWNVVVSLGDAGDLFTTLTFSLSDFLLSASLLLTTLCLDDGSERDVKFERIMQGAVALLSLVMVGLFAYVTLDAVVNEIGRYYYDELMITFTVLLILLMLGFLLVFGLIMRWEIKGERQKGKHEVVPVVLLTLFFQQIYLPIWVYQMTKTLRKPSDRSAILEVVLCMFVPFYQIYWIYKFSGRLHEDYTEVGIPVSNFSATNTVLMFLIPAAAVGLFQSKYNYLCQMEAYQTMHQQTPDQEH